MIPHIDSGDVDLLSKMSSSSANVLGGDEGLGDEEEPLIDDYDDADEEDDASFTVHFAHHGRKDGEYKLVC